MNRAKINIPTLGADLVREQGVVRDSFDNNRGQGPLQHIRVSTTWDDTSAMPASKQ